MDLVRRSDVMKLLTGGDDTGYKPSALREMVQQIPNALPCELGDPLYCVTWDDWYQKGKQHYIVEERVAELLITEDGVLVGAGDGCYDKPCEVVYGCGCFLTKAEAEAVVKQYTVSN